MKIILATNNYIHSVAIRVFTWSEWSHAGIIMDDGSIIESTAKCGVCRVSMQEFKNRYTKTIIVEIPNTNGWANRAESQIGKKYDWGAILRFVFRGDWADDSRWFCFELVAYVSGMYNPKMLDKVTANQLLMVSK